MTASLYLYAVLPADAPVVLGAGIDGTPLRRVVGGALAAIVHDHAGEPYAGDDDVVRRRVLEHGEVVDRIWAQQHALLPVTFDVLVAGDDADPQERLRDWLVAEQAALRARLDAIGDRVELQVDVTLDPETACRDDPAVRAARAELEGRPPGVQRLLRKRVERLERDLATALAERLHSRWRPRLAALCADVREPRRRRPAGTAVEVLRLALLVDEDRIAEVGAVLAALAEEQEGTAVAFLGPWPPYSFAEVHAADARGAAV